MKTRRMNPVCNISIVETARLDGIEAELHKVNKKLDMLLKATVSPAQLAELAQDVGQAKHTSDALKEAIEKQSEGKQKHGNRKTKKSSRPTTVN